MLKAKYRVVKVAQQSGFEGGLWDEVVTLSPWWGHEAYEPEVMAALPWEGNYIQFTMQRPFFGALKLGQVVELSITPCE